MMLEILAMETIPRLGVSSELSQIFSKRPKALPTTPDT